MPFVFHAADASGVTRSAAQPHPGSLLLATSGLDTAVRFWYPGCGDDGSGYFGDGVGGDGDASGAQAERACLGARWGAVGGEDADPPERVPLGAPLDDDGACARRERASVLDQFYQSITRSRVCSDVARLVASNERRVGAHGTGAGMAELMMRLLLHRTAMLGGGGGGSGGGGGDTGTGGGDVTGGGASGSA